MLHAQCDRCVGLCCVLLPYSKDDGFGADKPGGVPCHHLDTRDLCSIHDRLSSSGWKGCVRFDCLGAGQQVTQVTYGGRGWREQPDLGEMGAVLSTMRQLHEVLSLLESARTHRAGAAYAHEIATLTQEVLALTALDPDGVLAVDPDDVRDRVRPVLDGVTEAARDTWPGALDLAYADLMGEDLRDADLRGARLRGALLVGADLRGTDLTDADLLGADVRDADVRGAQVDGAVLLTGAQRQAMRTA